MQIAASCRGQQEIRCPICSALVPVSTLNRLPLHKKICGLVRMMNKFRTSERLLSFHSGPDAVVWVEEGNNVYQGEFPFAVGLASRPAAAWDCSGVSAMFCPTSSFR